MQDFLVPASIGPSNKFEDDSIVVRATVERCSINVASGVENKLFSVRSSAIVLLGKAIQNVLGPCPACTCEEFEDGSEGEVDLSSELWGPVFEPLKDLSFFCKFTVAYDTLTWPNDADFAPEFLCEKTQAGLGK